MSGGKGNRTHLRTAPKISVLVRSSIKREGLRPARASLSTKYSALQHIPKHVQKMVAGYKSQAQKRSRAPIQQHQVITGDHWELLK